MVSTLWKGVILTLLQLTWVTGDNDGRSELEKEILQKLLMTSKFNIYVRPQRNSNETTEKPLQVSVSLYILNIDVDMRKEECNIQMYFREEWHDSRLAYDDQGKLNFLAIQDAVGFWTPDLFFVNEKFGQLHTVTKPNIFVRIYPQGRVLYSQRKDHDTGLGPSQTGFYAARGNDYFVIITFAFRLTVKLACPMDLRKYPFDTQICALPVESYGYTANDIDLKWKPETTFGNFEPTGFQVSYSTVEEVIQMEVNNYSRLELGIHLTRLIYPQLIHIYIPLGLLVVTSWVSFWLRPADSVLRLMTVLTTTFTTLMLLQSARELFYKVCYLTALDVWVGFCCLLVFAAVFENVYVIVNHGKPFTFQTKKRKDIPELPGGEKDKRKLMDVLAGDLPEGHSNADAVARMLFPSLFVLFNVIYLAYYLI